MIKINNIVKSIDGKEILTGVDLEIKKGSAFGLLGTNGAGKSTLLRLICGVYIPDKGEITIEGEPVCDNASVKERIFFVNDETVQFSGYTMKELRKLYKFYYPKFSDEIFEKLRKKVKLPDDTKLSAFSKGMKRQAVVIAGLACCTEYLILDEAFDGLDPVMRGIVKNMIFDAMIDRELTVIISSHNIREISEVCDTAAMLYDGKIIFCHETDSYDSMCRIQAAFKEEYTQEDFSGLDIVSFSKNQSVYSMTVKNSREEIIEILNEKAPLVLDIVPLTLEEIFVHEMEVHGYYVHEDK